MANKRFGDNPEMDEYLGTELVPMQSVDGGAAIDSSPVAPGDDVAITLARLRAWALTSPVNEQVDSYALELDDAFKLVTIDAASAKYLTVPKFSDVPFPAGVRIDIGQDGVGQVTVVADIGVTIRTPETLKLRKRWAKATLINRSEDIWDLEGDLEAAP